MQPLQGLLFDRLDPYRDNIRTTGRFEQRTGIGSIGLVALHVRTDVRGGQQANLNPQAIEPTRPVMR